MLLSNSWVFFFNSYKSLPNYSIEDDSIWFSFGGGIIKLYINWSVKCQLGTYIDGHKHGGLGLNTNQQQSHKYRIMRKNEQLQCCWSLIWKYLPLRLKEDIVQISLLVGFKTRYLRRNEVIICLTILLEFNQKKVVLFHIMCKKRVLVVIC